jgi:hypothetical protein
MFGAHEVRGLLGAQALVSKNYLLLQNNPSLQNQSHKTKWIKN